MTMGELATKLPADAPYTTLIVGDLEGRGLVSRTVHHADRRSKIVTITPAGLEAAGLADDSANRPRPSSLLLDPPTWRGPRPDVAKLLGDTRTAGTPDIAGAADGRSGNRGYRPYPRNADTARNASGLSGSFERAAQAWRRSASGRRSRSSATLTGMVRVTTAASMWLEHLVLALPEVHDRERAVEWLAGSAVLPSWCRE